MKSPNPADFVHVGDYEYDPDANAYWMAQWGPHPNEITDAYADAHDRIIEESKNGTDHKATHSILGRCDHCGARHNFGAVFAAKSDGRWIQVGYKCAANIFGLPDRTAVMAARRAKRKVPIYGNTYPVKDAIRALGGRWSGSQRCWLVSPSKYEEAMAIVAKGPPVSGEGAPA